MLKSWVSVRSRVWSRVCSITLLCFFVTFSAFSAQKTGKARRFSRVLPLSVCAVSLIPITVGALQLSPIAYTESSYAQVGQITVDNEHANESLLGPDGFSVFDITDNPDDPFKEAPSFSFDFKGKNREYKLSLTRFLGIPQLPPEKLDAPIVFQMRSIVFIQRPNDSDKDLVDVFVRMADINFDRSTPYDLYVPGPMKISEIEAGLNPQIAIMKRSEDRKSGQFGIQFVFDKEKHRIKVDRIFVGVTFPSLLKKEIVIERAIKNIVGVRNDSAILGPRLEVPYPPTKSVSN